ncbi:unnamed protein product [Lactuca virosa]|uniref:Uncharacterized protein n=1 Tax=Lactuca virosa TaxID=75947 RepID=A0AAU9N5Z4_9ASTR|nr:unnamed protein product [Lactuca virosa]
MVSCDNMDLGGSMAIEHKSWRFNGDRDGARAGAASSLYPSTLLLSPPPPPISDLLELRNLSNTKRSGE